MAAVSGAALTVGCSGTGGAEIGSDPSSDTSQVEPTPGATGHDAGTHVDASVPANDSGATETTPSDAGVTPTPDGSTKPVTPPDPDTFAWQTGANIGYGVATKDTQNPVGNGVFVAYAAYGINLTAAQAWATALYRDSLQQHGIRYIYAVQGPSDPQYSQTEIGNTKIIASILPQLTGNSASILVAAHASGTLVAHELFAELAGGYDPKNVAMHRVVYFNLDGVGDGLTTPVVSYLKRAYFVGARSAATNTSSTNAQTMQSLGMTYANAGGYVELDASASGCQKGGLGCMHMTPVTTKPHDPANADLTRDYSDFAARPVSHAYLEAKAAEAGF